MAANPILAQVFELSRLPPADADIQFLCPPVVHHRYDSRGRARKARRLAVDVLFSFFSGVGELGGGDHRHPASTRALPNIS